ADPDHAARIALVRHHQVGAAAEDQQRLAVALGVLDRRDQRLFGVRLEVVPGRTAEPQRGQPGEPNAVPPAAAALARRGTRGAVHHGIRTTADALPSTFWPALTTVRSTCTRPSSSDLVTFPVTS